MGGSGSPRATVDFDLSLRSMEAVEWCSVSDFETKDFVLRVLVITWHPLMARHH
jgi:hypothetical protein